MSSSGDHNSSAFSLPSLALASTAKHSTPAVAVAYTAAQEAAYQAGTMTTKHSSHGAAPASPYEHEAAFLPVTTSPFKVAAPTSAAALPPPTYHVDDPILSASFAPNLVSDPTMDRAKEEQFLSVSLSPIKAETPPAPPPPAKKRSRRPSPTEPYLRSPTYREELIVDAQAIYGKFMSARQSADERYDAMERQLANDLKRFLSLTRQRRDQQRAAVDAEMDRLTADVEANNGDVAKLEHDLQLFTKSLASFARQMSATF